MPRKIYSPPGGLRKDGEPRVNAPGAGRPKLPSPRTAALPRITPGHKKRILEHSRDTGRSIASTIETLIDNI